MDFELKREDEIVKPYGDKKRYYNIVCDGLYNLKDFSYFISESFHKNHGEIEKDEILERTIISVFIDQKTLKSLLSQFDADNIKILEVK